MKNNKVRNQFHPILISVEIYHFLPSKHLVFSKTSSRRFENVFSVTIFRLPKSLEEICNTSSKNVIKTSYRRLQDVFKTFSRRLPRSLQAVFARRLLQDVFKKTSYYYVLTTSWKKKNVTLKTSSRRLKNIFSTSSTRRIFAGLPVSFLRN